MASASESTTRANIRIEIKNDFNEEMEVDTPEESNTASDGEIEDGEIDDFKETEEEISSETKKTLFNRNIAANRTVNNQWTNSDGGFTTGVDIFARDEQEKLQTRAQRFGLDPTDCKSMTDRQLQNLHDSLGITVEDELDTRFEAIHMYGTQEMSTQDIFTYFGQYGPASVEWINDTCCNIVWLDKISSARAMNFLSRTLGGMPVTGTCNPFESDEKNNADTEQKEEDSTKGRSILLVSKTDQVEDILGSEDLQEKDKIDIDDIIHVSQINMAVPPGYWRLGNTHPKAKYVLLRFAKRTDKKPLRAERFSKYYKKYGNPNYGGMRGLISESKKKKLKKEVVSGNPWGSLAKNWNQDVFERPPTEPRVPSQPPPKVSKSILERLGNSNKRAHVEEQPAAKDEESSSKPETKKSKVPRMRMYADEEEARIERNKQLKKIRELEKIEEEMTKRNVTNDLRNRIGGRQSSNKLLQTDQSSDNINPLTGSRIKQEGLRTRHARKESISSDHTDDEPNVQQRSKVTVIVKRTNKPTMASTIWSRLDRDENQKSETEKSNTEEESSSSSSSSDSSDSESDSDKSSLKPKVLSQRPGFNTDLKARLGLSDHKSPLRIEINNDHYKKS